MSELLKRGLVFCIKSLDLVKVLIFQVGFIKVRVEYSLGPSQTSKVDFLRKWFSAVSR